MYEYKVLLVVRTCSIFATYTQSYYILRTALQPRRLQRVQYANCTGYNNKYGNAHHFCWYLHRLHSIKENLGKEGTSK